MKLISKYKKKHVALAALAVLALLALGASLLIGSFRSQQISYYNAGVELIADRQLEEALDAFDKSLAAYEMEQDRSGIADAILPDPSLEVTALTHKQRGLLFVMLKEPEMAIDAFKESLKLNPGTDATGPDAERLRDQALVVKYNLELLYKMNPELAAGEGQGDPGEGQKNQQPQPAPGNQPGTGSGSGDRNQI